MKPKLKEDNSELKRIARALENIADSLETYNPCTKGTMNLADAVQCVESIIGRVGKVGGC